MKCFHLHEKIAEYLLKTVLFQMHGYTVALDVRIRDVQCNGERLESDSSVPLLICDGEQVLCGIALNYDTAPYYNLDMKGFPYAQLFAEDHNLPMGFEDVSWLDHIPTETLERLLESLKRILIPSTLGGRGRNSYRLCGLSAEDALGQTACGKKLQAKFLLKEDGMPTPYGSAHGLFCCWGTDLDGSCFSRLMVAQGAVEELKRAAGSVGRKSGRQSLSLRLQQLAQLPEAGERLCTILDVLKRKPMDVLLQGHPEAREMLKKVLPVCQALLPDNPAQSEKATYQQILQLLQQLRGSFGTDAALDDWQSARMRRVSETLLQVLMQLFLPGKPEEKPMDAAWGGRHPLQQRLARNAENPAAELAVASLAVYYQAVSVLTDSDYPNWLYRTQIRPLIANREKPEKEYTLRFLAVYGKLCLDEDADGWKEGFPLLYCLLLPECLG